LLINPEKYGGSYAGPQLMGGEVVAFDDLPIHSGHDGEVVFTHSDQEHHTSR
jgi:hypothetical protein